PFLAVKAFNADFSALSEKDVIVDNLIVATPQVKAAEWKEFYLNSLRALKPGLTEMLLHLGHDDTELRSVMLGFDDNYGSPWRQRDFDFVMSPDFQQALKDNHITPIRWKDLQKLVQ